MNKKLLSIAIVFLPFVSNAQMHNEISLDKWEFSRDRQQWQDVCVPHDWAISGPFDKKWDLQVVAIEQNGEKE